MQLLSCAAAATAKKHQTTTPEVDSLAADLVTIKDLWAKLDALLAKHNLPRISKTTIAPAPTNAANSVPKNAVSTLPKNTVPKNAAGPAIPKNSAPVKAGAEDNYGDILNLAYLFYEGQMSGKLPTWNRLLVGKPGGYKTSAHLNDGKDIGVDLSGGYYDAGGEHHTAQQGFGVGDKGLGVWFWVGLPQTLTLWHCSSTIVKVHAAYCHAGLYAAHYRVQQQQQLS
jgi:hypothetical protein